MSETIKTLLTQELEKLEPQEREDVEKQSIEIAVENRLSEMGIRTFVPKKATFNPERGRTEYRGDIDLERPIEEAHVEEVRRYIAETLRKKLEGSQ
ncbi:hypothetical protein HZC21_05015 [Candidatus Peregrinibacteria bacterium]|nr:hypothetical protein [Candidatus Peregrinibacteria bacterium]